MDAVKEAVLEQKIDDLTGRFDGFEARFDQVEERNRQEHLEIRAEIRDGIGGLRGEMNEGLNGLRGEMNEGLNGLRGEMNEGFRDMRELMNAFNRTVIWMLGSIVGAAIAGVIVATVAQLL